MIKDKPLREFLGVTEDEKDKKRVVYKRCGQLDSVQTEIHRNRDRIDLILDYLELEIEDRVLLKEEFLKEKQEK